MMKMFNKFKNLKRLIAIVITAIAISSLSFNIPLSAEAQTGGILAYYPGSIAVGSVVVNNQTRIATISGGGYGGVERRYRVYCDVNVGGIGVGRFVQQLFSNPQPPITQPSVSHTVNPNNRVTSFSIDGSSGPQGNYILNRDFDGYNVGPTDDCSGANFMPAEYSFNFQVDISGLSIGQHNIQVSAFDEATRVQIYSPVFTFEITAGGGVPTTITKESRTSLAIIKKPTATLLVNGLPNATVQVGARPILSWATDSVEDGNVCTTSNDNSTSSPDPTWNGSVNGNGGGSKQIAPMNTVGSYTYSIICRGYGGSVSVASDVHITVGNAPSFNCILRSPDFVTIDQGSSTTASMQVEALNGFSENVTFTGQVLPSGPNSPVIEVPFSNNPQIDPYDVTTSAVISTSASTTVGEYQIIFTGTSEAGDTVTCPPVILAVDAITPTGRIHCNGQLNQNSCTINQNTSTPIHWESSLVTSCQIKKNGTLWSTQLSQTYPPGKDSGPLASNTVFDMDCTGLYGPVHSSVTVNVNIIPPQQPSNVQVTTSSGCGTATVTWDGPSTRPVPEYYQVYRSTSTVISTFTPIGPFIPENGSPSYSYTDTGPFVPDTRYYYAVAAFISTQSSILVPSNGVVPTPCAPSLNLSNKDLIQVNNNIQVPPNPCNNQSDIFVLPNRDIFKTGSKVTFNINVCNSGTEAMRGIVVTETEAHNLDEFKLESKLGGCILSGSGTGPYHLRDLPAPAGPGQYTVCTIRVSAKLRALSDPPTSFLHRFWNSAVINADNLPPKPVTTPPYLFSDTGTPVRNETAP